jgi:hypothetical protein
LPGVESRLIRTATAATISTDTAAPVIAGMRLRAGKSGSGKGAARMVAQAIATARAAGQILVRGGPAYGTAAVVAACRRAGARFSLVLTKNPAPHIETGLVTRRGPGSRWRLEEDSHHTTLVYAPDVDLTIAYGMHYHSQGRHEPEYEWSQVFASKSVRAGFADIFWRGSLIERVHYAIVDDHQGILPLGGGPDGLNVTSFEVVARLLHGITGKFNKFDCSFDRVHFDVTE